jgi:phospholipase/lecithinase/hemolysin
VRRLATILLALALLAGFASAPAASGAMLNHVAVIGDSYTTGSNQGGQGPNGWAPQVWQMLARQGFRITPDVAAEGGAGYGVRGNHGSVFGDLTARAVRPDDTLVVFFGSRNDQSVDPQALAIAARDDFASARRTAPNARLLVIGPPWPTADVPGVVFRIRDILYAQARVAGAAFMDPLTARWFFDAPALIGTDGVHPTDAGHAYMAQLIAPLIASQLTPTV